MKDWQAFIIVVYMMLAITGDCYTTSKGFSVGMTEGNPVSAWLQKKLGFALACFVGGVGALAGWGISEALAGNVGGSVWAGIIAAIETVVTIRNYKLWQKGKAAQAANPKLK
jgi:hypothetical protein